MVQQLIRHDRDISPINNHQGVLKNNNDPCVFYECEVVELQTSDPMPCVTTILELSEM
jgi:hypothetical protein